MLFDAVGTLIYPDPPAAEVYQAVGQRFGSRLFLSDIRQRFRAAMAAWNEPADRLVRPATDEAHERRRWQALVEAVFNDVEQAGGALFDSLWQHFAQPEHWRLYDEVPAALAQLRKRGYRLGIASNFDARLLAVAAGHPPLAAIDATFISSAVGHSKPDPRFFDALEQHLAAGPAEILLVGDDWINDIVGAQAAGWQAVLLDRQPGRRESWAAIESAGMDNQYLPTTPDPFRIASLAELTPLLDASR